MKDYYINSELTLPEKANLRFSDPSTGELDRAEKRGGPGIREIGGDRGDVYFDSFSVSKDKTHLHGAVLRTSYEYFTDEEAAEIAQDIVNESYESIGVETVY